MRIGVVGLGSIGRRHVGNLLALGCDVCGFDLSESVEAMAAHEHPDLQLLGPPEDDVDAIVIAAPWDRHFDWVERVVERRVPFFVEKPLGSLEQLPRWREIAAMDLPINQVGYMLRFHPLAQHLHERQDLGGTFTVDCDMRSWPGGSYGPMPLEMSHEIDLALWCGAPTTVTHAKVTESSVTIGLGIGWTVYLRSREQRYWREWVTANRIDGYQCAFSSPEHLGDQMYVDEMAHFLECVREQKPTQVPLSDGLKVLEVCAQVQAMRQVPV